MSQKDISTEELGRRLRKAYDAAPEWEKGIHAILFGIRYASHAHRRANKIAKAAGLKGSGTLVAMGVQLAPYVTVKTEGG